MDPIAPLLPPLLRTILILLFATIGSVSITLAWIVHYRLAKEAALKPTREIRFTSVMLVGDLVASAPCLAASIWRGNSLSIDFFGILTAVWFTGYLVYHFKIKAFRKSLVDD